MENNTSPPRPRGRPRGFDRATALAKAAETFRHLGYEGASIADLTAAMGITPQSLYAAFSSKADLYREALAQYRATDGAATAEALDAKIDVVDAFDRILTASARQFSRVGQPRGCMISTATLTCAEENRPVAEYVSGLRAEAITAFQARIERGIAEGDLMAGTDAPALARFLGAIIQGMSVQALDGATEAELLGIAAIASAEVARHRRRPAPTPPGIDAPAR